MKDSQLKRGGNMPATKYIKESNERFSTLRPSANSTV